MDTTFNQEFFDEMLNESIKEEINKKSAEKVLSKLSKTALGKLFLLDGKEFYIELLTCIGFIRITHLKDKNLNKAIDELKASTGLDGEDLEEYIRTHGVDCEESKIKGINTIKLICSKLLGFCKVMWNTSIVGLGLITRVSVRLVCNVTKAFKDTSVFAYEEAKCAGDAIKHSWEANMK